MEDEFECAQRMVASSLWDEESAVRARERLSDDIRRLGAVISQLDEADRELLMVELFHSAAPLEAAKRLGIPVSVAARRHAGLVERMLDLFEGIDWGVGRAIAVRSDAAPNGRPLRAYRTHCPIAAMPALSLPDPCRRGRSRRAAIAGLFVSLPMIPLLENVHPHAFASHAHHGVVLGEGEERMPFALADGRVADESRDACLTDLLEVVDSIRDSLVEALGDVHVLVVVAGRPPRVSTRPIISLAARTWI